MKFGKRREEKHDERFVGRVVQVIPQLNVKGAKIRPLWVIDENDATDDVFCSFKEAPFLKVGMTVSFRLDRESESGRWAAFEVSNKIIKNDLIERPSWYPDPLCLDLMRNAWKRTKDRVVVEQTEKNFRHRGV